MTLLVEKRGIATVLVLLTLTLGVGGNVVAQAQVIEIPRIPFLSQSGLEDRSEVASSLEILFFLLYGLIVECPLLAYHYFKEKMVFQLVYN